jgi:hypothetical protein
MSDEDLANRAYCDLLELERRHPTRSEPLRALMMGIGQWKNDEAERARKAGES